MEKEMKKLLLVAVSVGVFLMVTIIVALTVLQPSGQAAESAFYTSVPLTNGRIQPAAEITTNIPQEPVNIEIPETVTIADRNNGDSLTIQVPRPTSAAVPDTVTISASTRPAAPATTAAPAPAVRAPAVNTSASSAPAASARAPVSQPVAAAARPAAPRAINDYWIQIGAYSAIVRAEDVKENLATKGLITIIENRIINGQTLYRVRLGPYTSEREANHWLAIVKDIEGFHDSQVRQTVRQQ